MRQNEGGDVSNKIERGNIGIEIDKEKEKCKYKYKLNKRVRTEHAVCCV